MFNTGRYQPYEAVRNGDSSDEHEHEHEHENDTRDTIPSTKITDLLKLTAHRRIRSQNNPNNPNNQSNSNSNTATSESVSIPINETPMPAVSASEPGVSDLRDIDLEDTHRDSPNNASEHDNDNDNDSEGEGSHTVYDDHVWLLHLDGNKRKIGVCHTWSILDLKRKYFAVELKNGAKIRLIHRGKLLMDSMAWQSYDIATDAFIHVSITKNAFASKTNGGDGMHVHDRNYDEFDDGLDDAAVARRLQMELNRAELGASDDRLNYNAWNGMGMGMPQDPQQRESDLTRARREFFCGVLLGSIMGFWSLIFLLMAYRNQYSRRFRLGVSVGVAMNFMLGLMYQVPNHNAAHNSSSDGSSGEDGSVSGHLSDGQQVSETAGAT